MPDSRIKILIGLDESEAWARNLAAMAKGSNAEVAASS
jgi:hypothetical protein